MEYHMVDYMKTCVDPNQQIANKTGFGAGKLRKVDTPFHPLLTGGDPSGRSGNDLPEDAPLWGEKRGQLAPKACSILMKILCGARLARWDLLKVVQLLASRVTKWTVTCGLALRRLICYINTTVDLVLCGYVGDARNALGLNLLADADLGQRPY